MKLVSEETRRKQRLFCKNWYSKNKAKHIARIGALQKQNREQRTKYQKGWWAEHSDVKNDEYRSTRQQWRNSNRDKVNASSRSWAKKNRPKRRALEAKRRLLETAAAINLKSIKAWMQRVLDSESAVCYYCQNTVEKENIHFDHIIPLSKGGNHSPDNLCVSCATCNQSKSDKFVRVWIKTGQQLLEL